MSLPYAFVVALLALPVAAGAQGTPPPTPACGPNLSDVKNVDRKSRCFELRTYTVKPGQIDVLHWAFREHTTALFGKHGMDVIAFWQPVTMPNSLTYLLGFRDTAARDASWAAFYADPEWIATLAEIRRRLHDEGFIPQVQNVFLSATDYSALK